MSEPPVRAVCPHCDDPAHPGWVRTPDPAGKADWSRCLSCNPPKPPAPMTLNAEALRRAIAEHRETDCGDNLCNTTDRCHCLEVAIGTYIKHVGTQP